MDACGIEHVVNITMKVDDEAIEMIERYRAADPKRFSTIGWMDWAGVENPNFDRFVVLSIERLELLVKHGIVGFKFWKDLGLSVRVRKVSYCASMMIVWPRSSTGLESWAFL